MKIALGQINPTIGDFNGNVERILAAADDAQTRGADLACFPEMSLCGYPPRDLLDRDRFISAAERALDQLAARAPLPMIVGTVTRNLAAVGKRIHNSAVVIESKRVVSIHEKSLLPTYDVFDEHRHFEPAHELSLASICGRRIAVTICEDAWNDPDYWPQRFYGHDPVNQLCEKGAEIIVNISASPFTLEKRRLRARMLENHARKHRRPLVFVNQVGGQDDLVFDGQSLAFGPEGQLIARGHEFAEDLVIADLDRMRGELRQSSEDDAEAALRALVLGTKDYARRCGFGSAVLGLSGGIDSSVVAGVATRALGRENVLGVSLPSRYSSEGSLRDAQSLARALGISYQVIPIHDMVDSALRVLAPIFAGRVADVTEENLQARIRGLLLMALSNKLGHLLLTTGNKSEIGVGYCTLYGDMCGGLAVISDVPKTLVYRLAEHLNREHEVIPRAVFEKAPSAELRPNQTDQDTLPPYDLLDEILEAHIEGGQDYDQLCASGFDKNVAKDVVAKSYLSEYKRRQMAPGLKITSKAFGSGRRMPIAHAWKG